MYIAASDFDGTLSFHGVSQENRDAIRRFREAGNQFGIATGRDYWIYETLVREGIVFDFIIACSGAMTIAADGSYQVKNAQNKNGTLRGIIEYVGTQWNSSVDCIIGRTRTRYALHPASEDVHPASDADRIEAFAHLDILFPDDAASAEAVDEINRRWGTAVHAMQNGNGLNVAAAGIDKGEGIARYARSVGVPDDCVYCFGDNMNDLSMITRFHGCAVANAREEVKAAAEQTCQGVWEVLNRLLSE